MAKAQAIAEGRGFVAHGSTTGAPGARVGPAVSVVSAVARFVGFGDAGGGRTLPLVVGGLASLRWSRTRPSPIDVASPPDRDTMSPCAPSSAAAATDSG